MSKKKRRKLRADLFNLIEEGEDQMYGRHYGNKKEVITENPKIYIGHVAKQKLDLYIKKVHTEISGLGIVEQHENDFLIIDILLFEQTASSAATDLSEEDISIFMVDCIRKGIDTSKLKLWWHSHANMGVFWSATDENTIKLFDNGWMISLVGNRKGEILSRLDIYDPIRFTLGNLELKTIIETDPLLEKQIEDEIAEKVKRYVYTAPTYDALKKWRSPTHISPAHRSLYPNYPNRDEFDYRQAGYITAGAGDLINPDEITDEISDEQIENLNDVESHLSKVIPVDNSEEPSIRPKITRELKAVETRTIGQPVSDPLQRRW